MYLCFSIFLWSLEPFQRSKFLSQIEFLSALYFSPSFRGNIFICFLNHSKGMIFGRFWWVIWSHLAAQLLTNKTGFGKHFEVVLAGCLCKPFRIFSLFHARDKSKKKHLSLKNGLFENWHLSWLNSFVSLKNKWAIPGSLLENCFVFTVDQTGFFLTRAEEFLSYRSYIGFSGLFTFGIYSKQSGHTRSLEIVSVDTSRASQWTSLTYYTRIFQVYEALTFREIMKNTGQCIAFSVLISKST